VCQVQAFAHDIAVSYRKLWFLGRERREGLDGLHLLTAFFFSALQSDPIYPQIVLILLKGIKSYFAVALLPAICLKPVCIC